ncbi:MAG: radical SAM protein, partial [Anaerolineae bacterium]
MAQQHSLLGNLRKLLLIYYHYQRRSVSVPYLPIYMGIETSGLCNLRCVMCPHGQEPYRSRKRGHMSFDMFRRVVDEARTFVDDADLFGGGEPLLNPYIFDMIAYAKAAGIRTRLHTNATLLDLERSRALLESGLDFLSLSFEGYSKEFYERTRVYAIYEETLENIQRFLELKSSRGYRKPYTVLQVLKPALGDQTVEIEIGLERLRKMLAPFTGLNEFKVIPVHNYGGKVASVVQTQRVHYSPCTFLWYALFVLWDGTIVPCCVDWWGDYSLGNINDTTLKHAWNGVKLQHLRMSLASGQYKQIPLCKDCDRLWRPQRFGIPFRSMQVV